MSVDDINLECFGPVNLVTVQDNHDYIVKGPLEDYEPDPRGIGVAFLDAMLANEDKIAQIDIATGKAQTFGYVRQRCIKLAISMRAKGIDAGDNVSICSFNNMDTCVAFTATQCIGAIIASLDPTLSPEDTVYLLNKVRPKMIFCGPEALELMENAVEATQLETLIVVFGETNVYASFERCIDENTAEEVDSFTPYAAQSFHDTAVIFFSSGTTGLPKGICNSHYALLVQANFKFGKDLSVSFTYTTLYWISSVVVLCNSAINGNCRLVARTFNPMEAWEMLSKYKATVYIVAPIQLLFMINKGRPDNLDLSSLKDIIIGGGALVEEQIVKIRSIIPESTISLIYGLTEVAGVITMYSSELEGRKELIEMYPNSCGKAVAGCSYKIVDTESEEIVGPGFHGELRLKTDLSMNGYYKQDSTDAWDGDGWLRTGDVAYYNDARCFFIVDRIKDMLKFQSWHVVPAKLEAVLMSHYAVQEAVVIGIPHEEDGDHPMAVVVLVKPPPEEEVTPEILEKYVEERVHDRQRLRAGVKIIESIPKTPSAKPKRREIRRMVLAGEL